jgi:hypothetical protein
MTLLIPGPGLLRTIESPFARPQFASHHPKSTVGSIAFDHSRQKKVKEYQKKAVMDKMSLNY